MIEWAVCGDEGGKRNRHTHAGTCRDSLPWLLSAQMLDWGGAVNQRACVCKYARMCVRVCVRDSVWQWSEGYLAMTAADTMGPFLYLSIQCSLSSSHLSSCPPLPSPFLKSLPPRSSYSLFSRHFIFGWSVAWCTPVVCAWVRATNECHSLSRNRSEFIRFRPRECLLLHPHPTHPFPLVIWKWAIKRVKRGRHRWEDDSTELF